MSTRREQIAEILRQHEYTLCPLPECPDKEQSCAACTVARILALGLDSCPLREVPVGEKPYCSREDLACPTAFMNACKGFRRINKAIKGER